MSRDGNPSWSPTRKPSFGGRFFTQLFVLGFCVGFPAFVTAVAPVSWITFERVASGLESGGPDSESRITARARICTLFFIPYRRFSVPEVIEIDKTERPQRKNTEGEAHLVITSAEDEHRVPVSPANIDRVIEKIEAFRNDPTQRELSLFVVANWKFSIFAGGLASLFTVLYLVGILLGIGRALARLVRHATGHRQPSA